MNKRVALMVVSVLALAPVAQAQDEQGATVDQTGWSGVRLPRTEDVPALVKGVAVGPDVIVAVGQRTCVQKKDWELGRCWGQPWVSTDGVDWKAVEARSSGLELGVFENRMSGPEFGLGGVASGPGGFVAFGWARPVSSLEAKADRQTGMEPALWRSDDGASWSRLPAPESFSTDGLMLTGPWLRAIAGTDEGYVLGGTIYGKPAPRAAIWFSPDGLTWTLTGPDEALEVGAYVDTGEVPVAGGITAIVTTPPSEGGVSGYVAVGSACPPGEAGAGRTGSRDQGVRLDDWRVLGPDLEVG
jgi:hypothetical protein